jgi:hypothetical protein
MQLDQGRIFDEWFRRQDYEAVCSAALLARDAAALVLERATEPVI